MRGVRERARERRRGGGSGAWDCARVHVILAACFVFCLGLGLALGLGGGGGVASERARVCGQCPAAYILGQIQHKCASLTPRTVICATRLDGGQCTKIWGCMDRGERWLSGKWLVGVGEPSAGYQKLVG